MMKCNAGCSMAVIYVVERRRCFALCQRHSLVSSSLERPADSYGEVHGVFRLLEPCFETFDHPGKCEQMLEPASVGTMRLDLTVALEKKHNA